MTLETVKVVNGVEIKRYEGTKFPYMIIIKEGADGWTKSFYSFKTCKSAVEFINKAGA